MKFITSCILFVALVTYPSLGFAAKWEDLSYKGEIYACTIGRSIPQSNEDLGTRHTICSSNSPKEYNSYEEYCEWKGVLGNPKCKQWYYEYSYTGN